MAAGSMLSISLGNKCNIGRIGSSFKLPRPGGPCSNTSSSTYHHLLPPFFVILLRSATSTKSVTNIVSRRCNVDQETPSKAQLHPALSSIEKANWCLCSQSHVEDIYSILGPPDPGIPATHSETQLNLFDLST